MSKNKITVLLVEDEQTLAMIIKDTLEENDFIIHTANDGEEGLSLFFELHPDVLVADVMMPKMDGFEMVRRIRQTDKQTPVLFLTARSAINDVVEGFELGANDYLKKPFGIQELIIRIKALMGKAFLFTENKVANHFEIGSYLIDPVAQTAWNGKEAVEIYEQSHPDLILMDIKMPESGGQHAGCLARTLGRRQFFQFPKLACVHYQIAA